MDNNIIKHFTIPVFVPHAACPFQCIFCNQKKISGQLSRPSLEEAKNIIDKHLLTLPKNNSHIEIGFFGGSFTAIPINEQEQYLRVAAEYLKKGSIKGIRVSTRPDFIDKDIIALLQEFGVKTIELGAQSFDDEVLVLSGRGHKSTDIIHASKLIKDSGLGLGLQMMIGLPGDTLEKARKTALQIVNLNADCTRIYPTLVIKDTILESLYYQKKFVPLSIEEAVEWTKEIYTIFLNSNTKVIRIGLHPSDGLTKGDSLIAGPFHQSFKELVLTEIWKDRLLTIKFQQDFKKIIIYVAADQLNHAIGYQSANKKALLKKYDDVLFKIDRFLKGNSFYVNYN